MVPACTRGVVRALIDNTWDGTYALPYCATYGTPDNISYCYQVSLSYLVSVYSQTRPQLLDQCGKFAPGVAACTAAAPQ
jgi:hypothetical protein